MNNQVLIIGASSFLGVNLIPHLRQNGFAVDLVSQHLGDAIDYDSLGKYRCVLFLKPDADQGLIDCCAKDQVPILAIGSGALVDFKAGRMKMNPYIEGKQKIVAMASATVHPGFYIPDATHADTGRGLHRDTLMTLFSGQPIDDSFNMSKAYYMTPVSKLIQLIIAFAQDPSKYHGEYAFGSQMAISRGELHDGVVPDRERLYAVDMERARDEFGLEVTDNDVKEFRAHSSTWIARILAIEFAVM